MKTHNWMAGEARREKHAGTKGSFSRAAARAGYSTPAYAKLKEHAPGRLGRRARLAETYEKMSKNRG